MVVYIKTIHSGMTIPKLQTPNSKLFLVVFLHND